MKRTLSFFFPPALPFAIVKHIAQLRGGQATVSSKPGEGATFTLVI